MASYKIQLSVSQDKALQKISKEVEKTPQELIDEQVSYYIKKMLQTEAESQGLNISGFHDLISDEKQAEFLARLLNAKEDLLNELKG
ncbi:MAG: hypothetical protein JXB48_02855 [Candidatus Latescibacteria bacterium]|nr:hypothetical protein [Candidatus Latescibacterota bacterium]